jgi:gas vesicle protein
MGQEPGAIRDEIEQTRERMGDTVEALAYKADVKSRAKESVSDKVGSLKSKVTGAAGTVGDATPSTGDVKQGARQAAGVAQENPLGLAIGAVAMGFLGGLLVPASRVENEKIGPMADTVKDQVRETAQTAVEHGKQAAQDAAQAAAGAVKETGQEHAEQAKSELADQAQQAKQQVASQAPSA